MSNLHNPMDCSMPVSTVLHYLLDLLKFIPIEWVMLHNHLIICRPLLLLPSILPTIRVFCKVSSSHHGLKYWSFNFSISPSSEYSGLISFRTDWLDLLAVQGTLKNLFQHHSSKASFFQCSDFFMVHLSRLCITTRNTNYVYISCSVMSNSLQPHGL